MTNERSFENKDEKKETRFVYIDIHVLSYLVHEGMYVLLGADQRLMHT